MQPAPDVPFAPPKRAAAIPSKRNIERRGNPVADRLHMNPMSRPTERAANQQRQRGSRQSALGPRPPPLKMAIALAPDDGDDLASPPSTTCAFPQRSLRRLSAECIDSAAAAPPGANAAGN